MLIIFTCVSIYMFSGKISVQFLRLGILGSLIEFQHMVALTNETQTMKDVIVREKK